MSGHAKELLRPSEVAKELRVSAFKVIGWIRAGELRASNVASKSSIRPQWLVPREAVDDFLAARQVYKMPKPEPRFRPEGIALKKFF